MSLNRVLRVVARMNVGGPAVQISGLMREMDQSRFQQRLVTGLCEDDEQDFLETQAPDVPRIVLPHMGRSIGAMSDFRALAELMKIMREFNPHIVHTHTAKAGTLGRLAAAVAAPNAKIVHTYHGHLLHGYFSRQTTRAITQVERLLAHKTDRLVAVGTQVREDLLRARVGARGQYLVVPPGVRIRDLPNRREAQRRIGVAGPTHVVSLIGRITAIKRPDRFVDVVRRVVAQRSDVVFVVAGSGDEMGQLREAIAREDLPVLLLGWRSDIETVLAASDVVLLTSDNEGMPVSLIQAGLAGVPVVATNAGAVRDVVLDGKSGFVCGKDSQKLAASLLMLLSNPQLRANMGDAGRTYTERSFSVDALTLAHTEMYDDLLADGVKE